MKYYNSLVTFSEIPDEITLCINITGCPNNCKGCHSPWLRKDIGIILNSSELFRLIDKNKGITCVCFMGGDSDPEYINVLASCIKDRNLKVGWYSGKSTLSDKIELKNFDYIKIGPYIEELGSLNNPNTNQRMYEVNRFSKIPEQLVLMDITYKFWKNERTEN